MNKHRSSLMETTESKINHRPSIAVIIPSLNGEASRLLKRLGEQTWRPDEVQLVKGVRPNGRARNQGVAQTVSEVLVFIDDDAVPGSPELIQSLVELMISDPEIGVTGSARVLPRKSSPFQRRVAAEIPRTVNLIPSSPIETNPPLEGYGHSQITTTCCAVRRSVFTEAGGFAEDLTSGVDTDFFYRVRRLGYRFLMAPKVFVEHPAPEGLRALIHKFHWYGYGYAQETRRRPQQKMGIRLPTALHRLAFITAATVWFIPNMFFLYSLGYPHFEFGFRPLKALSSYAVAWGYFSGWQKGI